jgi:hypothetical protein
VTVHLLLYGNAFVRKLRDESGTVDELWILKPSEMTVKWWPGLGEKTFVHYRPVLNGGQQDRREFDDDEVLHIIGMSMDGIDRDERDRAVPQVARDSDRARRVRGRVLRERRGPLRVVEMEGRIRATWR